MNLIMRGREKKTKNANPKKEGKMKSLPAILIGFLAYFAVGVSTGRGQVMHAPAPTAIATETPSPGVVETYKVVNGMNIQATAYNPDDGNTHRVAIVIHGGGYIGGEMETSVAQELSQFGF